MKDAKTIIRHIVDNPFYKELKNRSECGEFLQLLSLNHRRLIAFCYEKNGILFFALFHPLGLQELKSDSSIKMLKGLLNVSAPAVLLSYIRGMISQVTAFSGYPALIIPLINFSE